MNAILYQAVVFNLQPFKSLVPQLEWGKNKDTTWKKCDNVLRFKYKKSDCAVSNGQVAYANFMPGTLTLQASHNTSSLPLHAELAWRNVPETYGAQNRSRTHHQYET